MNDATASLWQRFQRWFLDYPSLGLSLDISRVRFPDDLFQQFAPRVSDALTAMRELEGGSIANRDENRMVGHYWLRAPELAPEAELTQEIRETNTSVLEFAQRVHAGELQGAGGSFRHLLQVGIGGSALGPQLIADALGSSADRLRPWFLDNTDPDGIQRVLTALGQDLARTLVIVVSKSGGTPETRNGMLEVQAAFRQAGLDFSKQAIAITQAGSALDQVAIRENWLQRFPMWDWVGGRTSVMSTVGLVPAALQGLAIEELLAGAAEMDRLTRNPKLEHNAAVILALMWHHCSAGRGAKDMVLLPYKDRLCLFSRYLQQLIMESLGKEFDRQGTRVEQGLAVYGNKGSTDQHAYVQQLRDGVANFFVTFIEVLRDQTGKSLEVETGITSGDYLTGFWQGTRQALYEKGRDSLTITLNEVSPRTVGALIALYERAVGIYAELVNINAYHQPGVEAGKKAAAAVLKLQRDVQEAVANRRVPATAEQIANEIGAPEQAEAVYHLLRHLAANPDRQVVMTGSLPAEAQFSALR